MRPWLLKLGIEFNNLAIYEEAMTHTSWKKENNADISYERLEFLGDKVIDLNVSHYLYKLFPDYSEGQLSTLRAKMVQQLSLATIAKKLGVSKQLRLSKSEESQDGRNKERILADAYESLVGAIFLDLGPQAAHNFLNRFFFPLITKKDLDKVQDYKTKLQEKLHHTSNKKGITYKTVKVGFDHKIKKHTFEVALYFDKQLLAKGTGNSKKQAEQKAAEFALKKMSK